MPSYLKNANTFILCPTTLKELDQLYQQTEEKIPGDVSIFVIIDPKYFDTDIKQKALFLEARKHGFIAIEVPSKENYEKILNVIQIDRSLTQKQRSENRTAHMERETKIKDTLSDIILDDISNLIAEYDEGSKKSFPNTENNKPKI